MTVTKNLTWVESGGAEISVGTTALGITSGDVRFCVSPLLREVTSAHTGETPLDYIITGLRVEVIIQLAEYVLANITSAMPHAEEKTTYASLGALPGTRLSETTRELTLHPIELEPTDTSRDITIHNAVCISTTEIKFSPHKDRLIEAKFVGLLDTSRTDGDLLARISAPARS